MQEEYPSVRKQLDELQMVYEQNQKEYEGLKKKHPEERVENKNEALYYKIRDMFNHKIESEYLEAVVYFFINKTAYSGMIRYNAKGEYNVPFGRYKNLNTKLITDKHYELLKRTEIYNYDYSEIFNMAGKMILYSWIRHMIVYLVIMVMKHIETDLGKMSTEDWQMTLQIYRVNQCW